MNQLNDFFETPINIGDIILYPKHSSFCVGKVKSISNKSILVSCNRAVRSNYKTIAGNPSTYVTSDYQFRETSGQEYINNVINSHNGSKRINYYPIGKLNDVCSIIINLTNLNLIKNEINEN